MNYPITTLAWAVRFDGEEDKLAVYLDRSRAEFCAAGSMGKLTPLVSRDDHLRIVGKLEAQIRELKEGGAAKMITARQPLTDEQIDDATAKDRDALAARLAEIERAEPVAWIEHELQGTGSRHLHLDRRPDCLRDDVIAPIWTALIAKPEPRAAKQAPAEEHVLHCSTCGPDGCPDRVACPIYGGAA